MVWLITAMAKLDIDSFRSIVIHDGFRAVPGSASHMMTSSMEGHKITSGVFIEYRISNRGYCYGPMHDLIGYMLDHMHHASRVQEFAHPHVIRIIATHTDAPFTRVQ
jgi:hypothetical protein